MQKTGRFETSLRIILAITSKDVLDALKNKTILSQLLSALVLSAFFTIMPRLSDTGTPLVFLADNGHSSYLLKIESSDKLNVRLYDSVEEMQTDFIKRADRQLALVLPTDFDQTIANGSVPQVQGYALNWVSEKTIAEKKAIIQSRLADIIGSPVEIIMAGGTLYMLPDSNGGMLEAAGIVVILLTTGMLLVPNLLLEEKRTRTLDALLVSPANSSQIAIAKTLTGIFYVSIFAILVVAANGYLILQWGVALWDVSLTVLVSVSVGLLLGILIDNRQRLVITTQILLIPLVIPILLRIISDVVPGWLSDIIRWIPSAVVFDLLRISFSNQSTLGQILPRLGILIITFLSMFWISAWQLQRMER
jgi:ABC-type multidrug transport system permease subunit